MVASVEAMIEAINKILLRRRFQTTSGFAYRIGRPMVELTQMSTVMKVIVLVGNWRMW